MRLVQVELRRGQFINAVPQVDEDGVTNYEAMITWLELDSRVRKNRIISLRGDDKRWIIYNVFNTVIDSSEIKRTWNNNI